MGKSAVKLKGAVVVRSNYVDIPFNLQARWLMKFTLGLVVSVSALCFLLSELRRVARPPSIGGSCSVLVVHNGGRMARSLDGR